MSNIFDLPTSVQELSASNTGMANKRFVEVSCARSISDGDFAGSQQEFKFNISGTTWFIPRESFFRVRMNITRGDGAAIQVTDDVAPSFAVVDSMYRALEFRMGGLTVSRIGQYCPQISALKKRQDYSTQWRNALGQSIGMYDTDYADRQNYISSDAKGQDAVYTGTAYPSANADVKSQVIEASSTLRMSSAGNHLALGVLLAGQRVQVGTAVFNIISVYGDTTAETKCYVSKVDGTLITPIAEVVITNATNTTTIFRASYAQDAPSVGGFEFMWQPCLSIFDSEKALPVGSYSFLLQPEARSVIERNVIQSITNNRAIGAGANDWKLNIRDVKLYVSTVESARVDDLDYYIDLKEIQCAPSKVIQPSWSQFQFIVQPSLTAVSVAFQDIRCDTDTRASSTLFKVGVAGNTSANLRDFQQNKLTRFNLSYAGLQYPTQDTDQKFTPSAGGAMGLDNTTQVYLSSMLANGGFYTDSGTESIQEFRDAGMYLSYQIPKDGNDRSTDLIVRTEFEGGTDVSQMNVLMFQHFRMFCEVKIRGGQIISVVPRYN